MKRVMTLLAAAATLATGLATSFDAEAHGWRSHRPRTSIVIGAPTISYGIGYWPRPIYYTPYYTAPFVLAPSQPAPPPVYVERPAVEPVHDWFFCASSQAYYPYVDQCAEGWVRVPAQPPAPIAAPAAPAQ